MRMEHRRNKSYFDKSRRKILEHPDKMASELLAGMLKVHNDKEKNVLYPFIDNTPSEARQHLFTAMQNMPPVKYVQCCHGYLMHPKR